MQDNIPGDKDRLIRYAALVRLNSDAPPQIGHVVAHRDSPHAPIGILLEITGAWATIAETRKYNPIDLGNNPPAPFYKPEDGR